jgi:hypothetical protein
MATFESTVAVVHHQRVVKQASTTTNDQTLVILQEGRDLVMIDRV